jgi:hypothetical protein
MLDVNKTALQTVECTLPTFRRWAMIFVAHFLAKRTLEVHSARFFQAFPNDFTRPKIKILAVKSEEYRVPTWEEFKRVIREALTNVDEEEAETIIKTLEMRVKGEGKRLLGKETQYGLTFIKKCMEGGIRSCVLRMHCEAVFAALLDARSRVPTDTDTDELKTMAEISKVLGFMSRCNTFR